MYNIRIMRATPITLHPPPGTEVAWLHWALTWLWCWLLIWPLRRGLRSALGGGRREESGPPTRPRRPKASRARCGRSPLPYPSAS